MKRIKKMSTWAIMLAIVLSTSLVALAGSNTFHTKTQGYNCSGTVNRSGNTVSGSLTATAIPGEPHVADPGVEVIVYGYNAGGTEVGRTSGSGVTSCSASKSCGATVASAKAEYKFSGKLIGSATTN
ncbi:MAG: hypothetical protein HFI38_06400 [Lachnospiraceae bacterium]|jgi:hypothetical protein|nr:hypothetical protein [Lachnospiraceae bacterium]